MTGKIDDSGVSSEVADLKQFVSELNEKFVSLSEEFDNFRVVRVNELVQDLDIALSDANFYLKNIDEISEGIMHVVKNREFYLNKSGTRENFIVFLLDRLFKAAVNLKLSHDVVLKFTSAADVSKRKILNTLK